MAITFSPIEACADTQPFAECHGADLSQPLDRDTVETIRSGLLRHGLVLFRGQQAMTPATRLRSTGPLAGTTIRSANSFSVSARRPRNTRCPGARRCRPCRRSRCSATCSSMTITASATPSWHQRSASPIPPGTRTGCTTCSTAARDDHHVQSARLPVERRRGDLFHLRRARAGAHGPGVRCELERCTVAYIRCPNDEAPDEARRVTPGPAYMADEGTRRLGWAVSPHDPSAGLLDFELNARTCRRRRPPPPASGCIRTGEASLYVTPSRAVHLLDVETGAVRHGIEETMDLLSRALLPSAFPVSVTSIPGARGISSPGSTRWCSIPPPIPPTRWATG